jgi:hypothetical protein
LAAVATRPMMLPSASCVAQVPCRERIMLHVIWLFVVILVIIASPAEARRVALVIGNADYKVGPLANPVDDADAMATAFSALGFDRVLLRKNLGIEGFRTVLSEVARESVGAEVAVVFYAGHGTERDGRNYLIPVDARLDRVSDLDLQAIALSIVLDQIAGATKLKLVILDACRNNVFPLAGVRRSVTRGLARIEPEDNTLVVYAAKEGTLAEDGPHMRHSPFTAALLNHIATPGREISVVFRRVRDEVARATGSRQQPHLYGTLGGEPIYLRGAAPVSPNAELEAALKAADQERTRLAEERHLLEEERTKLALAVPPPNKQAQEESTRAPQEAPPAKQAKEKESDAKRVVLLPKLVQPKGPGLFDGAWRITWSGGTNCAQAVGSYVLRIQGGIVGSPYSGSVSASGVARWTGRNSYGPLSFSATLRGNSGSGVFDNAGCSGTITARRS